MADQGAAVPARGGRVKQIGQSGGPANGFELQADAGSVAGGFSVKGEVAAGGRQLVNAASAVSLFLRNNPNRT